MRSRLLRLFSLLLVIAALAVALLVGIRLEPGHASACSQWYHCPVTQRYGTNAEHGVDLATHGLPITALRSGIITFVARECWERPCIVDVTWKLDFPSHAGGSQYMYLQIASSCVHVGQHVADGQKIGMSGSFIEFGLTPDRAYGVSGWHWGINPLRIWPWL